MSLEVSGQPEGITLIQAIEAETIPLPEPMSFPKWQHWRKHEGRRPTKKKDGIARTTADEVKLWKEVMVFFHDIKSDVEEEDDEEEEEEEEKDKGQPEGITLIQAIEAETIPLPEPMSFPKWQHWRKHEGRRPTKKKDGIARTTADEVKLWKEVMVFFHDIKSDVEEEDDEEEEEEEEKDKDDSLELAPDVAGVPALPPAPATATEALAAAAAKAAAASAAKKGPASPSLLQMTCGRSSSRCIVRTKSH